MDAFRPFAKVSSLSTLRVTACRRASVRAPWGMLMYQHHALLPCVRVAILTPKTRCSRWHSSPLRCCCFCLLLLASPAGAACRLNLVDTHRGH